MSYTKIAEQLYGVTNGVAEVEESALTLVPLVRFDDVSLYLHAASDYVFAHGRRNVLQNIKKCRILYHCVLYYLRATVPQDVLRKGFKRIGIAEHQRRLMERAQQVLACRQVDRCFSADRCIHRSKQCGGQLNEVNASSVGGGGKTRKVTYNASAQSHCGIAAAYVFLCHEAYYIKVCFGSLTGFAVGNNYLLHSVPRRSQ